VKLTALAHAKVNLSLEITNWRPDGYHELVSVMQTVTLADSLSFEPADDLSLSSSDPELADDSNLALRAARALQEQTGTRAGVHIHLDKRIPVAAGLGGGSSDAAASIIALQRLWKLSLDCEQMVNLAAGVGSDVPFFLYSGTALVGGRGERVVRLPRAAAAWYLLVKPPISVSTARIFGALPSAAWTDGSRTRALSQALSTGGPAAFGINGLQTTLFKLYPPAEQCFWDVQALAPGPTIVTGSGPTVLAIFPDRQEAEEAVRVLRDKGYWCAVCQVWQPDEGEMPCT
jgi:4-diphosphocytidyl-2-C-methyl-D-erythritol kinase